MEVSHLSKRLLSGFISLTFRKIILDAINFIVIFVILAKILPVEIIGIFGIATSILSFFTYFSDIGLAGAIIQKKEVQAEDLSTTFVIQESLALAISIIVWFSAPVFANFYHFNTDSMWLVRALGIDFLLTSFKVIPTVLLERELKFEPIVTVDIIEALVFNGALLWFIYQGQSVWAFTIATLIRSVAGLTTIYILAPWKIKIGFSKSSAKTLIKFGVPFQLNSILALLKDKITPLVTARIIGQSGVGYTSWAEGIAYRPLEIMTIVLRVTFPAFSRLQDNHVELKKIVEKSLFLTGLFLYPMLFGMLAILPEFIQFMGKDKWAPAVPLIYLYGFSVFWSAPSTTFTNVLNAIGKVGITVKLMLMWTVLTWGLSPLLALKFGFEGVALAAAIISITSIVPIIIVVRMVKVDLVEGLWQPLVSSVVMGMVVGTLAKVMAVNIYTFVGLVILGIIIYCGLMILLAKQKLILNFKEFKGAPA